MSRQSAEGPGVRRPAERARSRQPLQRTSPRPVVQDPQKSPVTAAKISDTDKGGSTLTGGPQHMAELELGEKRGFRGVTTARCAWGV